MGRAAAQWRHRLGVRKLLPLALSIAAVVIASAAGWISAAPLGALVGAIVGAAVISEVVAVTLPAGGSGLALHLRIAAQVAGVTSAIYLTGWGGVLGAGYLYLVVDAFRKHGSRAQRPLLVWLSVAMAGGQVAITFRVAPTALSVPQANGAALLVFVALVTSVEFFGAVAREREREEARIRILLRHSADAVVVIGDDGTLRYASPGASRVLGGVHVDALGRPALDLVHPDDLHLAREVIRRLLAGPGEPVRAEMRLVGPHGSVQRVEFTATNLLVDEAVEGIVVNARDVSDRTPAAHVDDEARDHLTGLADRAFFDSRVRSATRRTGVMAERFAVLIVDLDHFDLINATAGESAGDEILREVARRLLDSIRPGDLVARLGDDEFAVLIGSVLSPDDVIAVGSRVTAALAQPYLAFEGERTLTCSVGVALCQPGLAGERVLQHAQLAVRAAKRRGGGRCEVFDANLAGPTRRRLDLEADLRRAIEHEEFVLHYQPVIDLSQQSVVGFEALVRWEHPRRGMISPGEFITLAEQSGVIGQLGRWVIDEACRQAGAWQFGRRGQDMHVNLSPRQLDDPALPARVAAALRQSQLPPERLVLEITETALMEDMEASVAAMHRLRDTGARFAIDDFGAGYSSFAYLARLPADILKVDRSLVAGLGGVDDDAVVETIVALAHRRGMRALAEGVEGPDQAERLSRMGCEMCQGFWFGRPVSAQEAAIQFGSLGRD